MTDPGIEITVDITEKGKDEVRNVFTRDDTMRFVRFLMIIPNGVIEFMPGFREIPRTSLSLGICDTTEDGLCTHSLVRSNVNSRKQMVMNRIICLAEAFEAAVEINGAYPAWELVVDSDFRWMAKETYERVTGKKAVVTMIHAGLECGILAGKLEGLDCLSAGPDLENVHTVNERMSISSTQNVWNFILALLEEAAQEAE
jgi:dipeptidase D